MKELLLITLTILTLAVYGQTSVYHPFPDSNAVWREYYYYNPCNCPGSCSSQCEDSYQYVIQGDSVIGSHTYHKFYRNGYHYNSYGSFTLGGAIALIRQDTITKKIFYYVDHDTLLYDFSMNVGDTLKGYLAMNGPIQTVGSIDSILIGTNYRKQFHFVNGLCVSDYTFIEGIGCNNGLFDVCSSFEEGGQLICFMQNGQTLFPDTTTNCPGLLLGTDIPHRATSNLTISPNPFSTQTVLQLDHIFKDVTLTIINCLGKTIRQINNISGYSVTLHRDNLLNGLYFVRLTEDSKVISTNKLIIID